SPPSHNGTGAAALGRSLDTYIAPDMPAAVRSRMDAIRQYVVAAAAELAQRAGGSLADRFPAAAAVAGKKPPTSGLDEAVREFMEAAGMTAAGKVWLRDGRS